VGEELNEETYYLIGKGFGTYLGAKGLKSIVIGGDARHSSRRFMDEFIRGAWKPAAQCMT
jgi:phosphomannomutase